MTDRLGGQASPEGVLWRQAQAKKRNVIALMEYVKDLGVDPVKDASMLWIAEEAVNAPLPPGWIEHRDDQERVFFHNPTTGESIWQHPMDGLYRDAMAYWRRINASGGFWEIDDELAERERQIRSDLEHWMETYDEHGEKFFYNKITDVSRFDDPRVDVYHDLYARIAVVAKMKDRLPLLANAPRPSDLPPEEQEFRRLRDREEQKYQESVLRIQKAMRGKLARNRMDRIRKQSIFVTRVPLPLKGKMKLAMRRVDGRRDLMLCQTTPHRENHSFNSAAVRIQTRVRGHQARRRWRPLIRHHAFLSIQARRLQRPARRWLFKRYAKRVKLQRRVDAVLDLQRIWRGHKGRRRAAFVLAEKRKLDARKLGCAVKLQCMVRTFLAYQELKRRKIAAEILAKLQRAERNAAVRIQAFRRGVLVRRNRVADFDQRREAKLQRNFPRIEFIQAQIQRFLAMDRLSETIRRFDVKAKLRRIKITMIQKHWRGWLARRQCERLLEQHLPPGEERPGENPEYVDASHSDDAHSSSDGSYLDAEQMMVRREEQEAVAFPVKAYIHKGLAAHKERMAKAAGKAAAAAALAEREPEPELRPRLPPSIYAKRHKPPPRALPSKSQAQAQEYPGSPSGLRERSHGEPHASPAKEAENRVMGKARRMMQQGGIIKKMDKGHRYHEDNASHGHRAPRESPHGHRAPRESPVISSRRSSRPPDNHVHSLAKAPERNNVQAVADREREFRNWHQRKDKESQARRDQDAQALQDLVAKSRGKEEALRRMEQARLEERTRRLKNADKRKGQALARQASMPHMPPLIDGMRPTRKNHQMPIANLVAAAGQVMPRHSSSPVLPRLHMPQRR